MECHNFTSYIDNINGVCGENINEVVYVCNVECMLVIVDVLNSCLEDLIKIRFDRQLENVISFCYNKNYEEGHRRQLGTRLHDFTLEELMIFSVSILGALGALLSVVFKSKCKKIDCCCIKCERDVAAVIEEEKLDKGKTPTPRPKPPPLLSEKEPEIEEP